VGQVSDLDEQIMHLKQQLGGLKAALSEAVSEEEFLYLTAQVQDIADDVQRNTLKAGAEVVIRWRPTPEGTMYFLEPDENVESGRLRVVARKQAESPDNYWVIQKHNSLESGN